MSYDISIKALNGVQKYPRAAVESHFSIIPGIRREAVPGRSHNKSGVYNFGHPSGRTFFSIYFDGDDEIEAVSISIPAAHNRKDTVALALLLGFQIAEKLDWRVYDEQAGEFYDQTMLADVLKSQKKLGETAGEILQRRSNGDSTVSQRFIYHLQRPNEASVVVTIFLSAVGAGALVYHFTLPARTLFWIAMGLALIILVASALFHALVFRGHQK